MTVSRDNDDDPAWAWVVLAGCFCMNLLAGGYFKSFGIIFVEFLIEFDAPVSVTSLILSVQLGMLSITSFVVMVCLFGKVSIRKLSLFGASLMSFGVIIGNVAPNIEFFIFSQGVCVGSGSGCLVGAGIVHVGYIFKKKRSIATAIASSGVSAGAIVLPPILRYLIDEYGFRGSLLITGGIIANTIVCASLYRSAPPEKTPTKNEGDNRGKMITEGMADSELCTSLYSKSPLEKTTKDEGGAQGQIQREEVMDDEVCTSLYLKDAGDKTQEEILREGIVDAALVKDKELSFCVSKASKAVDATEDVGEDKEHMGTQSAHDEVLKSVLGVRPKHDVDMSANPECRLCESDLLQCKLNESSVPVLSKQNNISRTEEATRDIRTNENTGNDVLVTTDARTHCQLLDNDTANLRTCFEDPESTQMKTANEMIVSHINNHTDGNEADGAFEDDSDGEESDFFRILPHRALHQDSSNYVNSSEVDYRKHDVDVDDALSKVSEILAKADDHNENPTSQSNNIDNDGLIVPSVTDGLLSGNRSDDQNSKDITKWENPRTHLASKCYITHSDYLTISVSNLTINEFSIPNDMHDEHRDEQKSLNKINQTENAKWCDLSLLKDPMFPVLVGTCSFAVIGNVLFIPFIPAIADEKGFSKTQASLLLTIFGCLDFASRLLIGPVYHMGWFKAQHAIMFSFLVHGVLFQFSSFFNSFHLVLLLVVVFGSMSGFYFSLLPLVVIDFLGITNYSKGYGFMELIHGGVAAATFPLLGGLRDVTGNYQATMHLLGVSLLLSCGCLLLEPLARRRQTQRRRQ